MRRYILAMATMTMLSFSNSGGAATPAPAAAGPAFTSAYTDLNKDCKAAMKEDQIGEGQDMPMRCKGYGGYYISISYSAWASHVGVGKSDGSFSTDLVNAGLSYGDEPGKKIEWRMADGKPFAVIARASSYDEDKASQTGDSPYQDKYKTGEWLIVKGLKGYESIDSKVDAKDPKANEKAREMADSNYVKK